MTSSKCLEGLELQLAEVEMLTSMYPSPGEFVLDDPTTLEVVKAVVSGDLELEDLENRLGFMVKISVQNENKSLQVELVCDLPHEYPFVKPQIFVRAPDICRERHKKLREDLNKELENLQEGEIGIGILVEWLRERLYTELQHLSDFSTSDGKNDKKVAGPGRDTMSRMWIYSHHIYSKAKRQEIQDWGKELKLHGFSMPGKPGIICAEGFSCDVEEFWHRVRRMSWKKIGITEQEEIPMPEKPEDISKVYKFDPFFELVLDARGGKGREYHMDLGQFSKYLEQHNCAHIFNIFFGLDSKQNMDGD
ncbi:RWD domain-containing protein 2A-like [Physella acuta]|uniref:RWD domain-containing protein 2A-like n=1 Tax=Physella acuta TaxID=109671 RepID=UPI0027DD42F0|nr:RWD domain-containing protein 2A-like [Physella acuta]XP_059141831.1 RWD domain-containing protein 2A-like [Physella acuta]XP_059141832.1 RWD domain-containing protein 2A-like [Physella acuta]